MLLNWQIKSEIWHPIANRFENFSFRQVTTSVTIVSHLYIYLYIGSRATKQRMTFVFYFLRCDRKKEFLAVGSRLLNSNSKLLFFFCDSPPVLKLLFSHVNKCILWKSIPMTSKTVLLNYIWVEWFFFLPFRFVARKSFATALWTKMNSIFKNYNELIKPVAWLSIYLYVLTNLTRIRMPNRKILLHTKLKVCNVKSAKLL